MPDTVITVAGSHRVVHDPERASVRIGIGFEGSKRTVVTRPSSSDRDVSVKAQPSASSPIFPSASENACVNSFEYVRFMYSTSGSSEDTACCAIR